MKMKMIKKEYPELCIIGIGDTSKEVFDISLPWEKRNKLPNILKKVVSV